MSHKLPSLTLLVSCLLSPAVFGQDSNPRPDSSIYTSRRLAPVESIHRHSSTAYEGALRGQAAYISAAGEYLQDEAQAEILWQQAESLHYDNELKKTATALTRKKMLNDFKDYERARQLERQERSKQLWEAKYQELAQTYRLDEYEFNWETGAIYWPSVLAHRDYADYRQRLEVLLHRVVTFGESTYGYEHDEIIKVCQEFRSQLREDFAAQHPSTRGDYADAQRFLVGLKYTPLLLKSSADLPNIAMR